MTYYEEQLCAKLRNQWIKLKQLCFVSLYYQYSLWLGYCTAHKNKVSFTDFFNKCDQIRSFLRILSHLLKKSIMENFNFCAVFFKIVQIVLVPEQYRDWMLLLLVWWKSILKTTVRDLENGFSKQVGAAIIISLITSRYEAFIFFIYTWPIIY